MRIVAGVDIGNSTTECCIGQIGRDGNVRFLSGASCATTGTKGTVVNVHGISAVLKEAMGKIGRNISDISLIRLNEAAPVIGDTAMETLTETVITDSSMIGHNPSTPAGGGQAEKRAQPATPYDIPYRSLVPLEVDGLLLSGRNISGTHRAHASYRVMGVALATGQAAGIAAALSAREGCVPRELDYRKIQKVLADYGTELFAEDQEES